MSENVVAIKLALSGVSQVSAGLNAVAGKLLSVAAAFKAIQIAGDIAAKLVSLTKAAIDSADAMGKLAQQSGIAVEALSGLSFAARMGDLDSTEFANALKELGKEMAQQGQQAGSLDERLMELADEFADMPDGIAKNQIALDNFGKAGLKMIPFLNQGSEAIRRQREEAKEFGLVIDEQFAKNADTFNDNLFRIKSSLDGAFLIIARDVLPSLIQLTDRIILLTKETGGMAAAIEVATVSFTFLAKAIEESAQHPFRPWFLNFFNASNATAASLFAQSVVSSLKPVGDAIQNAFKSSGGKQELIDEEHVKRASELMKDFHVNYLKFLDERTGTLGLEDLRFEREKEELNKLLIAEQTKNYLIELATQDHENKKAVIRKFFRDQDVAQEKQAAREKLQRQQDFLNSTASILGSMAEIAKMYGEKGFRAWKAIATAQAVISGASAFLLQLGSGDPYTAWFRAIAAGILAGVQIAKIVATQPSGGGYMAGGYTGPGARNEIAGPAHRGEYIFTAPETATLGVGNLAALADSARGGGSPSVSVGGPNITNAILFSESDVRQLFKTRSFKDSVINLIRLHKLELGLT